VRCATPTSRQVSANEAKTHELGELHGLVASFRNWRRTKIHIVGFGGKIHVGPLDVGDTQLVTRCAPDSMPSSSDLHQRVAVSSTHREASVTWSTVDVPRFQPVAAASRRQLVAEHQETATLPVQSVTMFNRTTSACRAVNQV